MVMLMDIWSRKLSKRQGSEGVGLAVVVGCGPCWLLG